jgi:exportin-7
MEDSELARVEKLCLDLYASPQISHLERMEAHRALMILQTSSQYLVQCQYILEHSRSEYALLFAAKSIMVIVSKDWRNISSTKRVALHKFIFEKVKAIQDPNHFISKSFISVLCRVTRLGWITEASFRTVIDDIVQLFQNNSQYVLLALRALSELVTEFNQAQFGLSSSGAVGGRLVAQAFRERFALTRCFHIALDLVQAASQEPRGSQGRVMLKEALHALQVCLEFDFVGTSSDDSDDGTSCLYIPAEWASHIATAAAVKQLFGIYESEWNGVQNEFDVDTSEDGAASTCLQILALLTAARRSVFDQASRRAFLAELLLGSTNIITRRVGLSHSESCLHHMCRSLAQIKTHFQLQELSGSPQYPAWLQTVTQFTIDAYSAWATVSSRSVSFLSSLWSSMVLPIPYLRFRNVYNAEKLANSEAPPEPSVEMGLNEAVPKVLAAYVQSRCDMCAFAALESLEDGGGAPPGAGTGGGFGEGIGGIEDDPLDDESLLLEELACFPVLTRFNFPQAAVMLESIYMDAHRKRSSAFQALIQPQQNQQVDMRTLRRAMTEAQARLAFLTYFIGVVVGGNVSRVASNCIENLDGINAELASLVFGMVMSTQQAEDAMTSQGKQPTEIIFGMGSDSGLKLELASLYFFRCFQNLYIESRAREDVATAENKRKQQQTLSVVSTRVCVCSMHLLALITG